MFDDLCQTGLTLLHPSSTITRWSKFNEQGLTHIVLRWLHCLRANYKAGVKNTRRCAPLPSIQRRDSTDLHSMASRTLYKLFLLKISLFILLLSSYRLQGTLASSQEENSELNEGEKVRDNGESELIYEQRAHELGRERVPHVFVGMLARNVAYLLSNFFGCLENLDYPKESMTIWWV